MRETYNKLGVVQKENACFGSRRSGLRNSPPGPLDVALGKFPVRYAMSGVHKTPRPHLTNWVADWLEGSNQSGALRLGSRSHCMLKCNDQQ